MEHSLIDPAILSFGTPVVLLSTIADNGTTNTAPMSSIFWLGQTAVLGMGSRTQTAQNLLATGECVINLPSVDLVTAVDTLARTTGRSPVPAGKADVGYHHQADKLHHADLHGRPGDTVRAERIDECPVNLEARIAHSRPLTHDVGTLVFEAAISRVHVHNSIRMAGTAHRVDPDRWRPLIMNSRRFYGLGDALHPKRLSSIDEEWYRQRPNAPARAQTSSSGPGATKPRAPVSTAGDTTCALG